MALGIDSIEGQAGLPGAADARDHREAPVRNNDVDALEIVLSGTLYYYAFQKVSPTPLRRASTAAKIHYNGLAGRVQTAALQALAHLEVIDHMISLTDHNISRYALPRPMSEPGPILFSSRQTDFVD